jgi:hypothetical protein
MEEYKKWLDKQIKTYEDNLAKGVQPPDDWGISNGNALTFYHLFGNATFKLGKFTNTIYNEL